MLRAATAAASVILWASPLFAQTVSRQDSDETIITGEIAPICTVETLTPAAIVEVTERADQRVTAIVYTCNSVDGITRRVTSLNGGALVRGAQNIPYRLSEDGPPGLAFSRVNLSSIFVTQVASFPELTRGAQGTLSVYVPATPPRLLAGVYADTITIEIVPN